LNAERDKKLTETAMQYEFDKKEAATRAEQEQKDMRHRLVRNGIAGGLTLALLFLGVVWRQRNRISKEKARSEELLLNILPEEVAEELKVKGSAEAVHIDQVTVLFTDFKGFTAMSEKLSPQELVRDLNECFSAFDRITEKHGIEKIKTIGDAYMAAGGLPTPNTTHAADVIKAALEMRDFIAEGKARKIAAGLPFFEIRIGVHTGPVVAGIVGIKKFSYDIWGDTVNTASRMESSGEVGQVNISGTTYEIGKNDFKCVHRGKVQAKGKGELDMYFVEGRN
jgi:class 3 adenylate cyclase